MTPLRHSLSAALIAAALAAAPAGAQAPAPDVAADSTIANFLAARAAETGSDYVAAVRFVRAALAREPENFEIQARALSIFVAAGEIDDAARIARAVIARAPANAPANLVLGVVALAAANNAEAEARFAAAAGGDVIVARITVPLARAWSLAALNRYDEAHATLAALRQTPIASLVAMQRGMIAELAGNLADAEQHYQRALAAEGGNARTLDVVAAFYRRNNRPDDVRAVFERFRRTEFDSELATLTPSAAGGLAEALTSLAIILRSDNGPQTGTGMRTALTFAQLARRLAPGRHTATLLIGEILDSAGRHADANQVYERIPRDNPLSWQARLRVAQNLRETGQTDAALAALEVMAAERPDRTDALLALAGMLRVAERYRDSAQAFTRALERTDAANPAQWSTYYYRAIAYHLAQDWPRAEADFLRALELFPEQPDVMNYLAYSWVERGENYERAEQMLRRAVELRPESGHIIDSLAWVYYRTGRFPEAVTLLERAIELVPLDATLLDHLGDAYWRVGRLDEARVQWQRALRNNPEAALRVALQRKVERGLEPLANVR